MIYDAGSYWSRTFGAMVAAAIILTAAEVEASAPHGGSGGESFSADCGPGTTTVRCKEVCNRNV